MRLHDALRTDSELREEVEQLFEAERQQCLAAFEQADPTDHPKFGYLKARLDALRQLRFRVVKKEQAPT